MIAHTLDLNKISNRSEDTVQIHRKARQQQMSRFARRQPNYDGAEIYGLIAKKIRVDNELCQNGYCY